jgi:tight adherence protein C
MTGALLAGVAFGAGCYLLLRALFPPRPGLAASLAAFDAANRRRAEDARPDRTSPTKEKVSGIRAHLGRALAQFYESRGWEQRTVRADLAIMERSWDAFLATKFLLPAVALLFLPIVVLYLAFLGFGVSFGLPLAVDLLIAVLFFFLPDIQLRQEAGERRRDFRHVVGAFLDLVAMNLAGGRGLPEALMTASTIGDHWAMARIRQALANARLIGITPWDAMARLGEDLGVEELRDLASALALAGDEGAKIRASLLARAASLRRKELADVEGKAGERSQSMLVAQLVMCAAFMLFLGFPAGIAILGN